MCGLMGQFGARLAASTEALKLLAHRGPDNHGEWLSPDRQAWLGHRRLSIVDLSDAGNQPMIDEDGQIAIVVNGEIYNHPDLRRQLEARGYRYRSNCDSESLLYAYREWGDDCLDHLEGMFAFILWDIRNQRVLAARDRLGIKPLYWSLNDDRLSFSSEAKALLRLAGLHPRLDMLSLAYVMALGYVPSPLAIWQGMQKLPAGHRLTWRVGEAPALTCYWQPPDGIADRSEDFETLFPTVLDEHLLSDVPIGLFLSAGYDSTSIAAGLHDLGRKADAITISFPQAGSDDEAPTAARTAAHLGLSHRALQLAQPDPSALMRRTAAAMDEPQGYSAPLTMFAVSEEAARSHKVLLAGDGGDECFAGYSWYAGLDTPPSSYRRWWRPFTGRPLVRPGAGAGERTAARHWFAGRSVLHRHAARLFPRFLPEEIQALLAPTGLRFDDEAMLAPLQRHFRSNMPLRRALQRVDVMTFCTDSILAKVDRTSMAHALEVRVPFLDRRMVDWGLSRPVDRREENELKVPLRDYLTPRAPAEILSRSKQGFSLRGITLDTARMQNDIMASPLAQLFDKTELKQLLAPDIPYRDGRLWVLASLDAWYAQQDI